MFSLELHMCPKTDRLLSVIPIIATSQPTQINLSGFLPAHCVKHLIAAYELANADVICIIGPDLTVSSMAVNPVCAGLHIPHILPLATDPTINLQDNPYTARVGCILI